MAASASKQTGLDGLCHRTRGGMRVTIPGRHDEFLDIQLAWIALFNKRCTGRRNHVPVWDVKPKT